ncbi:histidine N-acetyltransferase-like [Myripristis murdjan]|uniref:histidine N-acetyltransferase-like n=1 Tax=Myripristis murdjan TaxID=586833 RepID=UPI001175EF86|nr:histidine N-acetyltransferase-like [Myripristis murdjan]
MERKCLGEREGLSFWLAQPDDYDSVMSISKGMSDDYLPHFYHYWMKEPGRTVLLARREGKLVAVQSWLIADEGGTAVFEGLRVSPTERGRGISWAAILCLVGQEESLDDLISHLKQKLQFLGVTSGLIPLNETQLKKVLLDPKLPSRVQLPGGSIIQTSQPLQLMEGNLEILKRWNLTWLADNEEDPVFLSFYAPSYPVPYNGRSTLLNINIFGTDYMMAQGALVGLLEAARSKEELKGTILFQVHMPWSLVETLQAFCDGHQGFTRCGEVLEQVLLEMKYA